MQCRHFLARLVATARLTAAATDKAVPNKDASQKSVMIMCRSRMWRFAWRRRARKRQGSSQADRPRMGYFRFAAIAVSRRLRPNSRCRCHCGH